MKAVCIQHKFSDSLVYQFNRMLEPNLNDGDTAYYTRDCVAIYASPNVSYQDILNELESKEDHEYLESATRAYHRFFVSLTVHGFKTCAMNCPLTLQQAHYTERDRLIRMAKELVCSRDFDAAGRYLQSATTKFVFMDFWPKD